MADQRKCENDSVPALRFEGFSDPWEQHKVGDFLVESRELGAAGDLARKLTVKLWGKGVVEKNDMGGSEHTQYYIRRSGQFIYSKLDFLNAAFGVIPDDLDGYESTADLPAFDIQGLNANFLLLQVTQKNFYLAYGMIADGSRKAKRIHTSTFLDMPLLTPSAAEQSRIGALFAKLDSLITLHQRKVDKLKTVKQSLLEKMFPREGENVPEIRFEGFTDPWEQRRLGELFVESEDRSSDLEILSVSVANGIYPASDSDREINPGASLVNYKVVRKGDVVYNSMRMWQGAVDSSLHDGIVSPAYVVARPVSMTASRFFARLLKRPNLLCQYQRRSQGNSKDTQVLKFEEFAEIEVSVPLFRKEQEAIGSLADALDSLITLHQREEAGSENPTSRSLLPR